MRLTLKAKGFEDQPILARQAQIRDAHGRYTTWLGRFPQPAGVVELVDAPDSKSGARDGVRVRVPPPAPRLDVVKCTITVLNNKLL